MPITRGENDAKRFRRLLYYLNDEYQSEFWETGVCRSDTLIRPSSWPERKPLVKIYAWTLMPNHFHLLLQEIKDSGTSQFMQRLCGSMSRHFNEKYQEQGSIFQGPFKSRTINTDRYMRWALSYVMVKNVFELYPGGLEKAIKEFERAWKWATKYPYSSFPDYVTGKPLPIIDESTLCDFFTSPDDFKTLSRDMVLSRLKQISSIQEVTFE